MEKPTMREPISQPAPTVLVVDDDDFFHMMMGEYLSILGVKNILTAKNGKDALKLLKTHAQPVDHLVCDVFMPDMDGIEFLNHLAEMKYTGGVVVASGVDVEMLALARTIATANGLLLTGAFTKPIALSQLSQALGIPMHDGSTA
jgi:CheY-like chemotaxis protein